MVEESWNDAHRFGFFRIFANNILNTWDFLVRYSRKRKNKS